MSDTPAQPWFLTTALLSRPDGAHTAVSGLSPAADERTARLDFMEQMLGSYGPHGWAVSQVMAAPIPEGMTITVALPDEPAGDVSKVTLD